MVCPILYEINTRCWLSELSQRTGTPVTLANIPEAELAEWLELGVSHVWLMGVWSGGPRSRDCALSPEMLRSYREALPDCTEADVAGSPYAIASYTVSDSLGGEDGLRSFRERLRRRKIRLVLDFVPNHLGLDHPWLIEKPDLFVQSPVQVPGTFDQQTSAGPRWLAHGRDPYFPPWTDTVQLDYRKPATRSAMLETLQSVAQRCDGVRCDMAMLILNEVFGKTWAAFPCSAPASPGQTGIAAQFWETAIAAVRKSHSEFLFLAEAYWGLEPRLQSLGFDYTYDKGLYDAVVHRNAAGVRRRLREACAGGIESDAHFLENHDEPRLASLLTGPENRAAALLTLALPGMRFLHDGQLKGARIRAPVQLLRRPVEAGDPAIAQSYRELLRALAQSSIGRGAWAIPVLREAWPGNATAQDMVVVQWQSQPPDFSLAVVNLAPHRSQCYTPLSARGLREHDWRLVDLLGSEEYRRSGNNLARDGLYLDVPEHAAQLFEFRPMIRPGSVASGGT